MDKLKKTEADKLSSGLLKHHFKAEGFISRQSGDPPYCVSVYVLVFLSCELRAVFSLV